MHEHESAQAEKALLAVARELRHFPTPGNFEEAICRMANSLAEVLDEGLTAGGRQHDPPSVVTTLVAVAQMLLSIDDDPTKAMILLLTAQSIADDDRNIPGDATDASVDEKVWASLMAEMDAQRKKAQG